MKTQIVTPGMRGHISDEDHLRSKRVEELMKAGGKWSEHGHYITVGKLTFGARELHVWDEVKWKGLLAQAQKQ